MNEIEKMFFHAMADELFEPEDIDHDMLDEEGYIEVHHSPSAFNKMIEEVIPQAPIEIYFADFLINMCWQGGYHMPNYIVEIDGHDYHKTKQQRHDDYERERFLLKKGYIVIRFTGSEVYVDAHRCARETVTIIKNNFHDADLIHNQYMGGYYEKFAVEYE